MGSKKTSTGNCSTEIRMEEKNPYEDDEFLNDLRVIINQAREEKWNSMETGMVVRQLHFLYAMKYNEPETKGVISDG
jgi:hypothetical protein